MKKIITLMIALIIMITTYNVNAANYELKELIPLDKKTTIVTKRISYKQLYYNSSDNTVYFEGIKNISQEELPLSFSIAFFDSEKNNIGLINYCDKNNNILAPGTETTFKIEVTKGYLGEDFSSKDIKYVALLEDNYTCKVESGSLYIGQKVEDIGKFHGGQVQDSSILAINVISFVAGVLLVLFLYQFLFTNKFRNMDGEEVRNVLKNYKNEHARADTYAVNNKHSDYDESSIINKSKTSEMADKEAEENEKSRRKDNDLYNMYK